MPVLTIDTNIVIEQTDVLNQLSALIAKTLGKPESYVMIKLNDQQQLLFAGTDEAAAYCSLTSLGLNDNNTASYSETICHFLESNLNIPAARTYIEFKSPERSLFGWNKGTF